MKNESITSSEKKWLRFLLPILGVEVVIIAIAFHLFKVRQSNQISNLTHSDCAWFGKGVAWIDENKNGVRDENEQPLANVTIYVDDIQNGYLKAGGGPSTNWKGETGLGVALPGCPHVKLEVYPEIPPGYQLTTSPRLNVDMEKQNQVFEFGFNYLPGIPTVTPLPPKPDCQPFKLGLANTYALTDLAITPNGNIWATSYGNGVYQLIPNSNEWINYNKSDGLAGNDVMSITTENNNSIWFGTNEGVSHFEDGAWTSYTTKDGLIADDVVNIAIDGDNLVWFATSEGVSMLDLSNRSWRSFTTKDGLADNFVHSIAVAPDGSVWFTTFKGVSRLTWPSRPLGTPKWQTYGYNFNHIEVRPDDLVWFAGDSGIAYFNLKSNSWENYDYQSISGGFGIVVNTFAFAQDRSLWIGSATDNVIYHLISGSAPNQNIWRSYDSRDGLPKEYNQDDKVEAIAIASDDSLWVATTEYVTRCVFPNG